ncbi:MAG: UUP1 family membrane protein, partial [Spirochaetota bacterium]|nr:UUP1 family membrane protein [Spirochaetota bacterium]
MNNRQLTVLVLILIAISSSLFLYKFLLLGFPLTPDKTVPVWKLETKIDFHALNEPVKVSFFIPQLSQNYTVSSENFISGDFGFNIYEKESNRHTIWSIRKAKDKQTLYYQAILRKSKEKIIEDTDPPGKLVVPVFKEPKLSAVKSLLNTVRAKSADIDSLVAELFNRLNRPIPDENVKLLLGKKLKKPSLLKK